MGLDMYLNKKIYVGADYAHNKVTGTIDIKQADKPIKIDLNKVTYVVESAGYWRKANAIHGWFVTNVQDGEDDCKEYEVGYNQLLDLKSLCLEVLETKDPSKLKLEPKDGFFFGPTDVDGYYFQDLKETVKIIEQLDPDCDYYYSSSW